LSVAGFGPVAGFWAHLDVLRSTISVTVPPEFGFLPHQNIAFVIYTVAAAACLIVVGAVYCGLIKRVLLDDDFAEIDVLAPLEKSPTHTLRSPTARVGVAIAAAVLLFGIFPELSMRVAARATLRQETKAVALSAGMAPSIPAGTVRR
jgi:hypothetical protein